jgi:hypothetical protein
MTNVTEVSYEGGYTEVNLDCPYCGMVNNWTADSIAINMSVVRKCQHESCGKEFVMRAGFIVRASVHKIDGESNE